MKNKKVTARFLTRRIDSEVIFRYFYIIEQIEKITHGKVDFDFGEKGFYSACLFDARYRPIREFPGGGEVLRDDFGLARQNVEKVVRKGFFTVVPQHNEPLIDGGRKRIDPFPVFLSFGNRNGRFGKKNVFFFLR